MAPPSGSATVHSWTVFFVYSLHTPSCMLIHMVFIMECRLGSSTLQLTHYQLTASFSNSKWNNFHSACSFCFCCRIQMFSNINQFKILREREPPPVPHHLEVIFHSKSIGTSGRQYLPKYQIWWKCLNHCRAITIFNTAVLIDSCDFDPSKVNCILLLWFWPHRPMLHFTKIKLLRHYRQMNEWMTQSNV